MRLMHIAVRDRTIDATLADDAMVADVGDLFDAALREGASMRVECDDGSTVFIPVMDIRWIEIEPDGDEGELVL